VAPTFLEATNPQHQQELGELNLKLFNFYNSEKASSYWLGADSSNFFWTPETHPYHLHLKSLVKPGSKVVELGCGSAHAYRNLQDLKVEYTGIEWSDQARLNAETFPDAKFISASFYDVLLQDSSFDVIGWKLILGRLQWAKNQ
jgi:SAM-dependent methyltransferase